LSILPNKARTKPEKAKLLKKLKFELEKALEKGWSPLTTVVVKEAPLWKPYSYQSVLDNYC
jgi:hypothetical protein